MRHLRFLLAFLDLIVDVSLDFPWVSNHNITTKYPDTWHILTDTTAQVNKQKAEALNQEGPLAITKLDMQQKSIMITTMKKNVSEVLLGQLGLGSIDERHDLPVFSGHLEEVVGQELLRGPALVNVHLQWTRSQHPPVKLLSYFVIKKYWTALNVAIRK